jgi:hypothetical protein
VTKLFEGYDFRTCYEVECEREREREREKQKVMAYGKPFSENTNLS